MTVQPMLPRITVKTVIATVTALFLLGADIATEPRVITLAVGTLSATDTERTECYVNIGIGAMLALHPNGEPCKMVQELVGSTGTLIWVKDK